MRKVETNSLICSVYVETWSFVVASGEETKRELFVVWRVEKS